MPDFPGADRDPAAFARRCPRPILEAVAGAVDLLLDMPPQLGTVRLGVVDGPTGSGKSIAASTWADLVWVRTRLPTVVFRSDLLASWADPFGWWPALERDLLEPFASGRAGSIRVNDWSSGTARPGNQFDIPLPNVLLLDGVSCGRAEVRERASVVLWVTGRPKAERLERAVARNGEASRSLLEAWQAEEDRFFAQDATAQRADIAAVT